MIYDPAFIKTYRTIPLLARLFGKRIVTCDNPTTTVRAILWRGVLYVRGVRYTPVKPPSS